MEDRYIIKLVLMAALALSGCARPPEPIFDSPKPNRSVYRLAAKRFAAVVVSNQQDVDVWLQSHFNKARAPKDADGGSAVPITSDGYFLTADHVLSTAAGKNVYLVLRRDGRMRAYPARIVWRSEENDLALIHAPVSTPDHYQWTDSRKSLPPGTGVMHTGIATGFSSPTGKTLSPISPDSAFSGGQRFKHDMPLEPGDSGGAVVDANGLLVGVNSAVEFLVPLETAFFIESEANRPNVRKLTKLIDRDRAAR